MRYVKNDMIRIYISRWAHPVGVRQSALWSSCPVLEKPEGVKDVTCESATCMAVCEDGKVAMGRRRIKCRWKRKKGFFWKRVSYFFDNLMQKVSKWPSHLIII